ncbi:hypothetical protein D3C72_1599770 [compost metagenome]
MRHLELRDLLGGEVFVNLHHGLHGLDELGHRDVLPVAQPLSQPAQPLMQPLLQSDLLPQPLELQVNQRRERVIVLLQAPADVFERKTELPQRQDALQSHHVILRVEAVPRLGSRGGPQQPNLLVVVKRSHREVRALRQITDFPAVGRQGRTPLVPTLGPDAT